MIKGLRFDQYLRESTKKPKKKTYKYPLKSEEKKDKGKTWENTLLINPFMKVKKSDIKGLARFEKKRSERKKRKEKEKKETTSYSQQAWRRYNHVTTQGWSLYDMSIHSFLMFKSLLMFFLTCFSVMIFFLVLF